MVGAEVDKATIPLGDGRSIPADVSITSKDGSSLDKCDSTGTTKSDYDVEAPPTQSVDIVAFRHRPRPDLAHLLPTSSTASGTIAAIACGPESVMIDVANACAKMQSRVLAGELDQLVLRTESFNW